MAGQPLQVARVWLVVAATTALSVLTGLLVWAGFTPGCDDRSRLTVAAAPEIAPAVREAAELWRRQRAPVAACANPQVTGTDPARVAAAIAARINGESDLAGVAPDGVPLPDVWIPDSTTWITRVRGVDRAALVPDATSIALSAVVLALPVPAARAQGWPAKRISWEYVLDGIREDPPLSVGLVEPRHSALGLSGLLLGGRLSHSSAEAAGRDTPVLGAYRRLSSARTATVDQLRGRMAGGLVSAALLTERAVYRYDATRPKVPFAAVYPEPAAPAMDYPYARLAGLSPEDAEAAGRFRRWLQSAAARRVLTRHGFRTPDGAVGPDFPTGNGVSPEPVPPPRSISAEAIDQALRLWLEVSLSRRVLAILDISESMAEPVPRAGGLSRLEVTRRATTAGMESFTGDSEFGLWVFATGLDGERDHRELVPVGPLRTNRLRISAALTEVDVRDGRDTALFDTIRAGYAHMVENYDPELRNTMVVLTDGGNTDSGGLAEDELLTELERLSDPAKQVHVIVIGIGPDVDQRQLRTVADAAGGAVFLSPDPARIGDVLLQALALPTH